MNTEALLEIAELMEELSCGPRRSFSLGEWSLYDENECHTTACAIGWAVNEKIVPGLTLQEGLECREGVTSFVPKFTNKSTYQYYTGWAAVDVALGLETDQTEYLFAQSEYERFGLPTNNPRVVAERIRSFVSSGGLVPGGGR